MEKMSDEHSVADAGLVMDMKTKHAWLWAIAFLALVWFAIAALLYPTFPSMVEIWYRSETYAHGFVILPIVLWLAWRDRHRLVAVETHPDWRALIAAVPLLALWVVAQATGVLVVGQYALVALWLTAVWALFGLKLVRAALFPLLFLLLIVPNGEFLLPPLVKFTTNFTVSALQLIGIPVYREGPYFNIPNGHWNVVEGCSGLRYLISSFTLGTLYAYLTYRTLWKRIAFSVASFIVPIVANGCRALMIVLIAHYSDNRLALGIDHYIYGWVWFGIVMMAMFSVGLIWREDLARKASPPPPKVPVVPAGMAVLLVGIVAFFPMWEGHLSRHLPARELTPPPAAQGWQMTGQAFADWLPHWVGMRRLLVENYAKGDTPVLLFVAYYVDQHRDAELASSGNFMVREKHPRWQNVGQQVRTVTLAGHTMDVLEARLRTSDLSQRLLAWQWDRVHGEDMRNPYLIKLRQALGKVLGRGDQGFAFIIATPYKRDPAQAEKVLSDFLTGMKPALDRLADRS